MKKSLVQYSGLYGDSTKTSFPNIINHENLAYRGKIYDWEIQEHIHAELYQVFFIQNGKCKFISGQNEHEIEGPSIILIPANTVHGFIFQPDVIGEVLTFSEYYLETIFKNNNQILISILQFKLISFKEDDLILDKIFQYKNQIINELNEEFDEKKLVVQLLFQLLFVEIFRYKSIKENLYEMNDNRTLGYFKEFQKQIKQTITETKSVAEYAQMLMITPVHLNRICQAIVQKSALQIIHEYLIIEAKKYLLNTSYTIAEISYLLNFNDPAYFTRMFKKQTGVSPSEFKKN